MTPAEIALEILPKGSAPVDRAKARAEIERAIRAALDMGKDCAQKVVEQARTIERIRQEFAEALRDGKVRRGPTD